VTDEHTRPGLERQNAACCLNVFGERCERFLDDRDTVPIADQDVVDGLPA
jgi:hypothetical protein